MTTQESYSLYVYGSTSRGDMAPKSDVDILAVVRDCAVFDRNRIRLPEDYSRSVKKIDLSIYSLPHLKEMFESGHLFAWHLFLESNFLSVGNDELATFGAPSCYSSYLDDVEPLLRLLTSISKEVANNPRNVIYEAGIAYVCARNIAMSISYFCPNGLNFGAYSPFLLGFDDNSFPLSHEEYEVIRNARLATTRGYPAPIVDVPILRDAVERLCAWGNLEIDRIARRRYEKKIRS